MPNQNDRPPRPTNSWILFRRDFIKKYDPSQQAGPHQNEDGNKKNKKATQPDLSKLASRVWETRSEEVHNYWALEAEKAKMMHKMMYPDYTYQPKRKEGVTKRNSRRKKAQRVLEQDDEEYATAGPSAIHRPGPAVNSRAAPYSLHQRSSRHTGHSYGSPSSARTPSYAGGRSPWSPSASVSTPGSSTSFISNNLEIGSGLVYENTMQHGLHANGNPHYWWPRPPQPASSSLLSGSATQLQLEAGASNSFDVPQYDPMALIPTWDDPAAKVEGNATYRNLCSLGPTGLPQSQFPPQEFLPPPAPRNVEPEVEVVAGPNEDAYDYIAPMPPWQPSFFQQFSTPHAAPDATAAFPEDNYGHTLVDYPSLLRDFDPLINPSSLSLESFGSVDSEATVTIGNQEASISQVVEHDDQVVGESWDANLHMYEQWPQTALNQPTEADLADPFALIPAQQPVSEPWLGDGPLDDDYSLGLYGSSIVNVQHDAGGLSCLNNIGLDYSDLGDTQIQGYDRISDRTLH